MTNPTSGWDQIPVTGKWLNIDGTPKSGKIKFTLSQRIIASDGTAIYPRGGSMLATLGTETGSISVNFPASDDPNISPTGWSIKVEEQLSDGSGQTYYIQPTLALLPGGLNLNAVVVPDTAPAAPPPVYMRGVAGGVAALDADGNVIDADGNVITGGAGATDLTDLADVNAPTPADGDALVWDTATSKWIPGTVVTSVAWTDVTAKPTFATVATTGAYSDLTGKPTIPATAADVGAVPTTRTVNGHALSANVTVTAADVGAATTAQGAKADTAVQPGSLATVATTGAYSDLTGKPTIPATPADIGAATAAQGAKADTAVQPAALATVATTGAYSDLTGKPTIPSTAADVGAVPTTRTVNSHALSANVTLTASDVGAATTAQGAKADTAVQPADIATKVDAAAPGVRLWPADTTFPTTGVLVGDLFPYIGEA